MKRCYAYIRVSTLRQGEGVSLESQREAITDFASRQNLSITHWFEEKETAAKCGRPIFTRMVKELRQGRADALIIHKLDRLTRNLTEYAKIGELIDSGIDVHTAVDSLDFRSRGGRLTAEIQAVIAADYVRNLREETLKGMNGRLKQGLYPFRAPIGYIDTGRGQAKTLDPERASLLQQAFELYATRQYSMKTLLPKLQAMGLTNRVGGRLSLHGLETLLDNPFYTGVIRIKRTGKSFPGVHERLISPALYERVQEIKSGKAGPKVTKHNHTYQGLFRCGLCAGPMVPEKQKQFVYYRCPARDCDTKTVREDVLVDAIETCLSQAELTEANAKDAIAAIERWVEKAQHSDEDTGLKLRKDNLAARQHRLTDALVDGMIDKDTFNERKQGLLLEAETLQKEQSSAANYTAKAAHLRSIIELTKSLQKSHEMADRGQKQRIVEITTSNRVVIGKNVYLEPQNWLLEVQNLASTPSGDPSRIEDRTKVRGTNALFGTDRILELGHLLIEKTKPWYDS
ncbi:recombinase family protein [Parasphingorhabdus halotolerans]|uniref:Recombinase family protein n=1 Tax=Parasphingorhabdus halotolerans TaxID=2725558 RepID=A0A6H2DJR8_9SPHN|nr:recombinase family protein [Parasphingorhabdus halotolerans]QJB68922.1 recombinase family protein [Parasphingorhabdus halotolerans]